MARLNNFGRGEITHPINLLHTAFHMLENEGLRLAFQDVAFNTFKAVLKFSILLQLCFYVPNRAADRTVSVQPKTGTDSDQRLRAHGSNQIHGHIARLVCNGAANSFKCCWPYLIIPDSNMTELIIKVNRRPLISVASQRRVTRSTLSHPLRRYGRTMV